MRSRSRRTDPSGKPPVRERARCASCPCRSKQGHTTRYHGGDGRIRYRFHPLCGEAVVITARKRHGGDILLTIRQPDGTLAQMPSWMLEDSAAVMTVCDAPRLTLACLRDLRLELDARLSSLRGDSRCEGDEHATLATDPTSTGPLCNRRPDRDPDSPGTTEADGAGERAPGGDGGGPESDGAQR